MFVHPAPQGHTPKGFRWGPSPMDPSPTAARANAPATLTAIFFPLLIFFIYTLPFLSETAACLLLQVPQHPLRTPVNIQQPNRNSSAA